MKSNRILLIIVLVSLGFLLTACSAIPETTAPGVTLTINNTNEPKQVSTGLEILVLLTVLTIAPSILILTTSFTRIAIVFSMLRSAIGTPTIPPNQVIIGLSLILTFFIMAPTFTQINNDAIQPYVNEKIDQKTAFTKAVEPIREFMYKQTRDKDIELFLEIDNKSQPETFADIPTEVLLPAFIISELRTAFIMGFLIYIPFLVIDMVVSSVLLSMGMMMLPPSMVSLPLKLLLFVMVDGWFLLTRSLVLSFVR